MTSESGKTSASDLQEHLQRALGADYRVERELGRGGMSRVFLARDMALDRPVVIKVLPPELANSLSADRFRREIQVAARLQHPHIVPVHAASSASSLLYYTMPYVEGESLGERLDRVGRVGTDEAVRVLRDVARALSYAHKQGVVHRDIKPDNILLTDDAALVADFGIAKAVAVAKRGVDSDSSDGASATLTGLGISVGTPAYMAPEQAAGADTVDHRADIYSLGVVAHQLLGGSHPFGARSGQAMMAAHVFEPAPPLPTGGSISPELAALVARSLDKDPDARPQSAQDVFETLDAVAAHLRPSTRVRMTHARRARVGLAVAAGLVLVTASLGLALAPKDKVAVAMALVRRSPAALHTNRVIVAPFDNATGDPRLESLGAMAADWVAQAITRAGGLEVVDARTTVVSGQVVDRIPRLLRRGDRGAAMAEETGAGVLVSGAIYRTGDSLVVQTKMTDVATGKILLTLAPMSGLAAAPTAMLDTLSRRVAANVVQLRNPDRAVTLGSVAEAPSLEAYEETLKGVDLYFKQDTAGYLHLQRAVTIDSLYPTPQIFLAFTRFYRGHYDLAEAWLRRAERLRDRMGRTDRAMLDHLQAEMRGDGAGALAAAEEMAAAMPGSAEAPILIASTALSIGRPRRALAALAETDPDRGMNLGAAFYWFYKTEALSELGRPEEALAVSDEAIKRFPRNNSVISTRLRVLATLRRTDAIEALIAEAAPSPRGSQVIGQARRARVASGLMRAFGDAEEGKRLAARWAERVAQTGDTSLEAGGVRTNLLALSEQWSAVASTAQWMADHVPDAEGKRHFRSLVGAAAAEAGDRATALRIDAEMAGSRVRHDLGATELYRARIAAHLRDSSRAVALLQGANVSLRVFSSPLPTDIGLTPLLGVPAFRALIRPKD